MFTGIVEAAGRVVETSARGDGLRVVVDPGDLHLGDVRVGDSIAVNGCCLTVVELDARRVAFDVSHESLACTTGFATGRGVNLEKALRLSDRLGGHLVSGHVDGVGRVAALRRDAAGEADLDVALPAGLARYVARKGSIAIDGVSLTINDVAEAQFTVHLIPHTLTTTTLGALAPGDGVNIEVDLVARYVERLRVDAP